jgi:hypothetical protein
LFNLGDDIQTSNFPKLNVESLDGIPRTVEGSKVVVILTTHPNLNPNTNGRTNWNSNSNLNKGVD